jgi:hypothetical protein
MELCRKNCRKYDGEVILAISMRCLEINNEGIISFEYPAWFFRFAGKMTRFNCFPIGKCVAATKREIMNTEKP